MSSPERSRWRLILEQTPRSGAWNMAIDRALMESAGTLQSPPTLRVYSWQPAAITLGKGQPETVVDHRVALSMASMWCGDPPAAGPFCMLMR